MFIHKLSFPRGKVTFILLLQESGRNFALAGLEGHFSLFVFIFCLLVGRGLHRDHLHRAQRADSDSDRGEVPHGPGGLTEQQSINHYNISNYNLQISNILFHILLFEITV